jgi:hypothetical protein
MPSKVCCRRGEYLLDRIGGSGITLIAAEKTARRAVVAMAFQAVEILRCPAEAGNGCFRAKLLSSRTCRGIRY